MKRYTLSKKERLCKRKTIKQLFEQGNSFLIFPYKVIWMDFDIEPKLPAKFGVTVSKKNFKSAVKRNRIKRLSREAYRLNKHVLYKASTQKEKTRVFMLIYISRDILSFGQIEGKIILILRRLSMINEKTAK
ncbi:MAG: ribonuclease P protein component [Bacteroidota bacterium]|nr:ribonuclease P protein component [Bacteroidota bacterium]